MPPEAITSSDSEKMSLPFSPACGHSTSTSTSTRLLLSTNDCSRGSIVERLPSHTTDSSAASLTVCKLLYPPPVAVTHPPTPLVLLRFHPYQPLVLAGDARGALTCWDTRRGECLARVVAPPIAAKARQRSRLSEAIGAEMIRRADGCGRNRYNMMYLFKIY